MGDQQSAAQISDLMSFPVITVSPDTPMDDVARILRQKGCTGLPVASEGALVGMISRRDFRRIKKESQLTEDLQFQDQSRCSFLREYQLEFHRLKNDHSAHTCGLQVLRCLD